MLPSLLTLGQPGRKLNALLKHPETKLTTHDLKVWPEFFGPIHNGDKLFELRYDDRYYKVGDGLVLREFAPCRACGGMKMIAQPGDAPPIPCLDCKGTGGAYTDRSVRRVITYLLRSHVALQRGYVILGLSL